MNFKVCGCTLPWDQCCGREERKEYLPLTLYPQLPTPTYGWICVRCGASNSPNTKKCDCNG